MPQDRARYFHDGKGILTQTLHGWSVSSNYPGLPQVAYTPGGLAYSDDWGSLRNAANMAFLAALHVSSTGCFKAPPPSTRICYHLSADLDGTMIYSSASKARPRTSAAGAILGAMSGGEMCECMRWRLLSPVLCCTCASYTSVEDCASAVRDPQVTRPDHSGMMTLAWLTGKAPGWRGGGLLLGPLTAQV